MSRPLNSRPSGPAARTGTANRFGQSRLGGGITPSNSNARIVAGPGRTPVRGDAPASGDNLGLNSERLRALMIARLRHQGIVDERVLSAMAAVARHVFVDQGLASRAYEDAALPIGHGQTISQPWVVARMLSLLCQDGVPGSVLEIGAGCGYQAAVLAHIVPRVYAVERVRGLVEQARQHLAAVRLPAPVWLVHADGAAGLPAHAPFDAIVVAAAGAHIPQALLEQLAPGGRLIAPEGDGDQHLVLVRRCSATRWQRERFEPVRFVPLRAGVES